MTLSQQRERAQRKSVLRLSIDYSKLRKAARSSAIQKEIAVPLSRCSRRLIVEWQTSFGFIRRQADRSYLANIKKLKTPNAQTAALGSPAELSRYFPKNPFILHNQLNQH